MPLLHPGDTFPGLTLTVPGGQSVMVPEAFAGHFGVMVFYRGSPTTRSPAGRKQRS
jgi:hypothetical protein